MILQEIEDSYRSVLDELRLTATVTEIEKESGGGQVIKFHNQHGEELLLYVNVDATSDALADCDICYYDIEARVTKGGDIFHFTRNHDSVGIDGEERLPNCLRSNLHYVKPKTGEKQVFKDEDLFRLIAGLDAADINTSLSVEFGRPRLSLIEEGEEIAAVTKRAGRMRYQASDGEIFTCKGITAEEIKEFLAVILADQRNANNRHKKI